MRGVQDCKVTPLLIASPMGLFDEPRGSWKTCFRFTNTLGQLRS